MLVTSIFSISHSFQKTAFLGSSEVGTVWVIVKAVICLYESKLFRFLCINASMLWLLTRVSHVNIEELVLTKKF